LAGVPFLVKDLVAEIAGMPFHEGSRFLRDHVSAYDSEIVRRWRTAGLVILGMTNCPEFGMVPATEPLLAGPTRNPMGRPPLDQWFVRRVRGGRRVGHRLAEQDLRVILEAGDDPELAGLHDWAAHHQEFSDVGE
jgi:hypothetical protein